MSAPVRFAVVGLGHIARRAVLPAFSNTRYAVCTAVVSSRPAEFANSYSYEQYDEAVRSGEFDAVYLALPNHLHHDYALRAMAAGRHVLSEKPLAVSSAEAEAMVASAKQNNAKLMVAYRHQFSPAHEQALAAAQSGLLGELRSFHSVFTLNVRPGTQRTEPLAMGGGTLPDIGVYCLNAVRHFFQTEPVAMHCSTVSRPDDERFRHVEEMCQVSLVFPQQRLAEFTCSFGSSRVMTYTVVGTKGSLHLDPVFDYTTDVNYLEVIDGKRRELSFPRVDQFALEIDHFAQAIQTGEPHRASGEEGLADVRLIERLYAAAKPLA